MYRMKKIYSVVFLIGLFGASILSFDLLGQGKPVSELKQEVRYDVEAVVCDFTSIDGHTKVPFRYAGQELWGAKTEGVENAEFEVTYLSGFTNDQKAAFQYAVDLWSQMISSTVPIRVLVGFSDGSESQVLASASTTSS